MTISKYIIEYLISKGVTDIFGYPGGMVTSFMNELSELSNLINTHITLHEAAAAFAACGYAQSSGNIGVAFATSGPGATNLITGIGNAYFDSIPCIFITGNVNSFESKKELGLRQSGFQETDIVSIVKSITKKAYYVSDSDSIRSIIEEAYYIATSGRKGPVLIDIPMNILKSEIDVENLKPFTIDNVNDYKSSSFKSVLIEELKKAKRPCLLLGNGIKIDNQVKNIRGILRSCPMPVVSSLISCDIITEGEGLEGIYYGFIGAYGNRTANFVVAKSDLVIVLGSRLSIRQVGGKRENFAPNSRIIRVDIDKSELSNKIRNDDFTFNVPLEFAIPIVREVLSKCKPYAEWLSVCKEIKNQVKYIDEKEPNKIINFISRNIPDEYSIVSDVGQHMVWVAQSFKFKPGQKAYFSGGMGSMGYALPASIGVYYGSRNPVICFIGDGGMQMCIEELQYIKSNKLPIKIIVMNNYALGMIRHFQEMYYNSNYSFTINNNGYSVPNFCRIAEAYGIKSVLIKNINEINQVDFDNKEPELIEVILNGNTYICPKLEYGKPNQDQEPLLDRNLYNYLMEL